MLPSAFFAVIFAPWLNSNLIVPTSSSFGNEMRLVFAMSKVALTDRNEERNRGIFETKEMVQGERLVEEKLKRAAVGK